MSGSLNKVCLLGHLGADPEVKHLQDGAIVANLRLATSETWKDKNTGEKKEKTDWHRITVWGKLAEIAEKWLNKGSKVYIEGKLQTRKWQDQSGADRYSTEVVLQGFDSKLIMLSDAKGGSEDRGEESQDRVPDRAPARAPAQQAGEGGGARSYARDDMDDTIPFITSDGCF